MLIRLAPGSREAIRSAQHPKPALKKSLRLILFSIFLFVCQLILFGRFENKFYTVDKVQKPVTFISPEEELDLQDCIDKQDKKSVSLSGSVSVSFFPLSEKE